MNLAHENCILPFYVLRTSSMFLQIYYYCSSLEYGVRFKWSFWACFWFNQRWEIFNRALAFQFFLKVSMKGAKGVLELDRFVSDILLIQYLNVLCVHSSFISLWKYCIDWVSQRFKSLIFGIRINQPHVNACTRTHARAHTHIHKYSRAHLQPRRDLFGLKQSKSQLSRCKP